VPDLRTARTSPAPVPEPAIVTSPRAVVTSPRAVVLAAIGAVAPDADLSTVDTATDLAEQLDLDSMDFLNVVEAIYDATGIEIPERDYPKLTTLETFAAYLAACRPS
jgi:acyl carrier protein